MSESSPTAGAAAPTLEYLTRPGVDVSQMTELQADYMKKDLCILVNRKDEAIGSAAKQDCHQNTVIREGKALHRAFSVFLFNANNEMLLQRRAGEKPTFPLRWTNTCCSHPLAGGPEADEKDNVGVKRAAIRKLEDELGITGVKEEELVWLTRIHYVAMSDGKWGEHEVDHLMFLKKEVEVKANPAEVCEVKYVSPDQLRAEFEVAKQNPEHLTPWFQMIAEQLLFGWWENGEVDRVIKAGGLSEEEQKKIRVLTMPDKPDTQIPEATP